MTGTLLMLSAAALGLVGAFLGFLARRHKTTRASARIGPELGSKNEFTDLGWRYRNLSLLFVGLAAVAVILTWLAL